MSLKAEGGSFCFFFADQESKEEDLDHRSNAIHWAKKEEVTKRMERRISKGSWESLI